MGGDRLSGKKKYNDGNVAKYFYPGEQPQGWILGGLEAKKLKNSEAQKRNWEDPAYRARQINSHNTAEYIAANKAWNKQAWEDNREDRIAANTAAMRKYFEQEKAHEMRRNVQRKLWEDPNYHEKQSIALKESHKDIYQKHPEYIEKIANGNIQAWKEHKEEILQKQIETKNAKKSWHFSKLEEDFYIKLLKTYSADDIKRQYNSDPRYPFKCDFYIISEDKFIELQGTWEHGKHPFDRNNPEDLETLNLWKSRQDYRIDKDGKIKPNRYYLAEYIWTVSDPEKMRIAKENNLNIEFIYYD